MHMDICKERIPKDPGDACRTDDDCLPTRAKVNSDFTTTHQTYLECDATLGVCVPREGPIVSDWLQRCDGAVLAPFEKGVPGAVPDPSCSEGLCIFYVPHDRTCVLQGCSKRCERDDQCPDGAVCQDGSTMQCYGGSSSVSLPAGAGYCKPGPRNLIGVGLGCW